MHRSVRLPSFLTASLFLTSSLIMRSASATQVPDEQLVGKIDALAAMRLKRPGSVGLSIAVARGDDIILAKGYGLADAEHDVAADAGTMFRVGSVTKQFTAAAIMRLAEQGKLSLDDDMTKYLPDYPTQGHKVTIRHLLTHTSGIKSFTGVEEFWQTGAALELSADELLAYVSDLEFDFVPGEQYKYSNTGYYMLGVIVTRASGVPYCRYLQDEFFTSLSSSRIRCDSNADIISNRAQGYGFEDGKLMNDRLIDMNNTGGAGMIIASARDLVAWKMALIAGEIVSAESVEQMVTPVVLPSGKSTGYGFGLNPGRLKGHRAIVHGGGVFGFSAMLAYFPDDDLYVAVLANVFGRRSAQSLARDIAIAAFDMNRPPADLAPGAQGISRYSGTYLVQPANILVKIFERDGHLFAQPGGRSATRLLYQGDGEFRASDNAAVRIVFDPANGGTFVLHQDGAQVRGTRQSDE